MVGGQALRPWASMLGPQGIIKRPATKLCSRHGLCDLISIPHGRSFCYVHFTEEKVEVLKCSGYRAGQGQGQDSSRQSPSHHHQSLSQENRTTPSSQALARPQLLSPGPGMWAPRDRSGWGGKVGGRGVGLGKEPWERCQMELRGPGAVRGWSGHPALSSGPCY